MPVVAVINRKGGSGKSTMATHLAVWMSRQGASVMLGDLDRQQSTRAWLKRRAPQLPAISSWAVDQKQVLKVPSGVTHVVLDTPGGMHGLELAKVVMSAHAIIIPVCNSLFDRESVSACIAELRTLPRIASGRCLIAVVGMRIDARTRAAQTLREWAQAQNVPFLGALRETQHYVRCLDSGLTVFDLQGSSHQSDVLQWEPILQWLQPVTQLAVSPLPVSIEAASPVASAPVSAPESPAPLASERIATSRPASLMPAQESLVHGSRLSVFHTASPLLPEHDSAAPIRLARERGGFDDPRFLLRH